MVKLDVRRPREYFILSWRRLITRSLFFVSDRRIYNRMVGLLFYFRIKRKKYNNEKAVLDFISTLFVVEVSKIP